MTQVVTVTIRSREPAGRVEEALLDAIEARFGPGLRRDDDGSLRLFVETEGGADDAVRAIDALMNDVAGESWRTRYRVRAE